MLRSVSRGRWELLSAAAVVLAAAPLGSQVTDTPSVARVHISIAARRLWVIESANDTIFSAPVAVGSGRVLRGDNRTWKFDTPLGVTRVVAKEENPVWVPPDWHYTEIARVQQLQLMRLAPNDSVPLSRSRALVVRGETIGIVEPDSGFRELIETEEIVFDNSLFVPPFGTRHRQVVGVLGPFRLILANGVGLHGTPFKETIGKAATHGCIRLHDEDIAWLYERIPIGTVVVIF